MIHYKLTQHFFISLSPPFPVSKHNPFVTSKTPFFFIEYTISLTLSVTLLQDLKKKKWKLSVDPKYNPSPLCHLHTTDSSVFSDNVRPRHFDVRDDGESYQKMFKDRFKEKDKTFSSSLLVPLFLLFLHKHISHIKNTICHFPNT